jgi:CheY-specific phosphatase CheX
MAVMFFGQYLVEKGIVSSDYVRQAIELQESVNLSVGETAVKLGLLTDADVERINRAQRTEDLRFGDMAIKLGVLTDDQFQQILATQKKNHLYIGEAIVKVGGLKETDLERYLAEFKADQARYATDRVVIPAGVANADVWELFADLTYKMLTRVGRLTFHPEPCVVVDRLPAFPVAAAMDFSGDLHGTYIFAASTAVQKKIAKAILNEESVDDEEQEVLDDTVMEFINVVLGNIAAKGGQLGKSIEITPPRLQELSAGLSAPAGQTCLYFAVSLADGDRAALAIILS